MSSDLVENTLNLHYKNKTFLTLFLVCRTGTAQTAGCRMVT
jgi:hypothetical protein